MNKQHTKTKRRFIVMIFLIILIGFFIGFSLYYLNASYHLQNDLSQNTTPKKSDTFEISKIFLFSSAHATRKRCY